MRPSPSPTAQDDRPAPFFVVGSDRSGTTLLRLYLDAHPLLAVPSESWFLIDLFEAYGAAGALDAARLAEAVDMVAAHPRFVDGWRVDLDALRAELAARTPVAMSEFIDALFRAETGISGEGRWGDKTPEYSLHLAELHRCFPRAQFVHIVRDGRDVYLSLAAKRWSDRGSTPYELGRYWAGVVTRVAAAGARLGRDAYLEIRYEDLVLDTRATLEKVMAFLGVPFDDAVLAAHQGAGGIITPQEREAGVHDKLFRPPQPDDVQRWRAATRSPRLWLAAGTMAAALRVHGYADTPGPVTAVVARNAAAYHHLWLRYAAPRLRRLLRSWRRHGSGGQ